MKTKIIAEVGPNHNGDIKLALEIISKLKNSGTDFIKFQIANPNKVYSKDAFLANYQKKNIKEKTIINMSKKLQLSKSSHEVIYKFCKKNNIRYSCSAFDLNSLKYIYKKFNLPFFKIPSGEILSIDILDYIRSKNLPILLSTGVSGLKDIEFSLNYLQFARKKNITIMHCNSSYPTDLKDVNLDFMIYLKKKFNTKIGFSDHTIGSQSAIVASSLGANYIEKHITLDRNMSGPDHKSSMEIDDFIKLVKEIKIVNKIKGKSIKFITKENLNVKKVAMKSCVTKNIIKKNSILKKSDICFKRPGTGIPPNELFKYIGKKVKRTLQQDKLIYKKDFY